MTQRLTRTIGVLLTAFCLLWLAGSAGAQAVYVPPAPTVTSVAGLPAALAQLQARTGKPVVVSSYNSQLPAHDNWNGNAASPLVGSTSNTSVFSRVKVFCPLGAINPQPLYINCILNAPATGENTIAPPTAVILSFAVEDAVGNIYPGTFTGRRTTAMDNGGPFIGDAVPIVVAPGGFFYERTMLQFSAGSNNYPVGLGSPVIMGNTISPTTNDPATAAAPTVTLPWQFAAHAWLGQQVTLGPAVVAQGDSILGGADGAVVSSTGYMRQALSGSIGLLSDDCGGNGYSTLQSLQGQVRSRMYYYATHAYIEHGTNDQGPGAGGGSTATSGANNLIGRAATEIRKAAGFGAKVILQTIMPTPSSLQGYTAVGLSGAADVPTNQVSPAQDAGRRCYNDWIRGASIASLNSTYSGAGITITAGTPTAAAAGMTSYVELADLFETNSAGVLTRNGGYWRVPAAPYLTGAATGGTTTTLTGAGFGSTSFASMVIKFTSGANSGLYAMVSSSSTTSITFGSGQNAAGTGVILAAPANGDTFSVYAIYTGDFRHPSSNAVAGVHTIITSGLISAAIFN